MKWGECCESPLEENYLHSSPQHTMLSLARVMGPLSPNSPGDVGNDPPANPYQILQIRRDATAMEIRQSYKRLALWHHPGRKQSLEASQQERLRRYQFFNLLAACYETLINGDTRRRYDNICRELEQLKLQAGVPGAMFVGGKPLLKVSSYDLLEIPEIWGGKPPFEGQRPNNDPDSVPPLSRSSSGSSIADADDADDAQKTEMEENQSLCGTNVSFKQSSVSTTPSRKIGLTGSRSITAATVTTSRSVAPVPASLMDTSTSEDEEEVEPHYTESTTRRLFGGPLSLLFKARNFEPFSDPFDIFQQVFGSEAFPRVSREDIEYKDDQSTQSINESLPMASPPSTPRSPAAWRGESHTSADGKTTIFRTSRVLHDRRLTRIETVTKLATGKTETHVTVIAEPLSPDPNTMEDGHPLIPDCLICKHPKLTSPEESPNKGPLVDATNCKVEERQKSICTDITELIDSVLHDMECTRTEFCDEWNKVVAYTVPFKLTSPYR